MFFPLSPSLLLSFSFISWKNIKCGHFLFIWVDNRKVPCGCGGTGRFQHLWNAFWLIFAAAESDFLVCLRLECPSFQITVNPRIRSYFLMWTTLAVRSSKVLSHSVVIVPRYFYKYSQIWRTKGWYSFIFYIILIFIFYIIYIYIYYVVMLIFSLEMQSSCSKVSIIVVFPVSLIS